MTISKFGGFANTKFRLRREAVEDSGVVAAIRISIELMPKFDRGINKFLVPAGKNLNVQYYDQRNQSDVHG